MFKVAVKITGLEDLIKRVDELDKRLRNKTLKAAVRGGAQIITKEAKAAIRTWKKAGLGGGGENLAQLVKALGYKVKIYRRSGLAIAIAGPRTGFKKQSGTVSRGPHKGKAKYFNPTNIAHLIEKGTRQRVDSRGKSSGSMPAFPFLRPAIIRSRGRVLEKMRSVLEAGLAGAEAAGDAGGND